MQPEQYLRLRVGIWRAIQNCWEHITYTRTEDRRLQWQAAAHILQGCHAGVVAAYDEPPPPDGPVVCERGWPGNYCGQAAGWFRWAADPPSRSKPCCAECAVSSLLVVGGGVIECRQPDGVIWRRFGGSTITMVLGGPPPAEVS